MPRHSHYRAALDDDDTYAELALTLPRDDEPKVPLAGYSEVVVRLDNIFDALSALNETLVAVNSPKKRPYRPHRAPRPETAYQRALRRQKLDKLDSIVQRMTGGR